MTDETINSAAASAHEGSPGLGRGGRMSRQRKMAAVLRLLRGEALELVSRALGVTAATLSSWRDEFLAGGEAALATKPTDAKALEAERLKAKHASAPSKRTPLAASPCGTTTGASMSRRLSRRNSPCSASRVRRRSCERRKGMAAPSASFGP